MKNQYYQCLLTILFYTILNAAVVASLSSKNKADKLGLSSNFNLGDNSNKEDLALVWPEVKRVVVVVVVVVTQYLMYPVSIQLIKFNDLHKYQRRKQPTTNNTKVKKDQRNIIYLNLQLIIKSLVSMEV